MLRRRESGIRCSRRLSKILLVFAIYFSASSSMESAKPGKTLWEMLTERLHKGGTGNGAGIPFSNPLDLRVGSPVAVAHSNGPEFADYDFSVQEIREYTRRIGGQEFRFADY